MPHLVDPTTAASVAEASMRQLTSLLRSGVRADAVTTPGWTLADTAAHVAGGLKEYRPILEGRGSPVARLDDIAGWNAETVRSNTQRDCAALADQIDAAFDEVRATAVPADSDQLIRWHAGLELPLATAWLLLAGEALVHGYDMATAAGRRWPMDNAHVATLLLGLLPLMPHYVDRERAAGLRACFDLRLRSEGRPRVFLVFEGSQLSVEEASSRRVDCHISADPRAFLLVSYGRLGPVRPALSGRIVTWGRRPWLALTLPRVLNKP